MKIGFTERGDAGIDFGWVPACIDHKVDGAVLITKYVTPGLSMHAKELHRRGFPVIVHATCTGWGGSVVEPNAPTYQRQLEAVCDLVDDGFPMKNVVLRIDPIFPTENGLKRVLEVVAEAERLDLIRRDGSRLRIRVSVLDEYPHVRARFKALGHEPIYGGQFQAPDWMLRRVADALASTGFTFETCAEHHLAQFSPCLVERGCLSRTDLEIMGLSWDKDYENNQHRNGCHCLGCKTELLTRRQPCPFNCAYCFWKRPGE